MELWNMALRRICSMLLAGWAAVALAGDGGALSLVEAERLWEAHSRELRLARTDVAGARGDVLAADVAPNPQLSVSMLSVSPQEGVGAGPLRDKKMDSIFRIDQLLERGNKRELRTQAAEARLEAAKRNSADIERQQRIVLRQAYYDLLLAQERKRIADDMAALQARGLDIGHLRLKSGDIAPADVARLSVERQRADNEARQAQADLEKARVVLAYLVGRETDAKRLQASDAWPALAGGTDSEADLSRRPDVLAALARVEAAEKARELARAQRTRDVTVGVQYEHNLQNKPNNSYGVGVSVPLFVRNTYDGEIARAEAELDAAREMADRTLALARGEVEQARSDLLASTDRRRRFEEVLLNDAKRVTDAAEFAYRKGAMSLMDLLDARRTWRQVQLEAAAARAEHAKALAAWQINLEQDKR